MLSKAHLNSHSRMSGSRWVITPSWFSGSWRSFCIVLLCSYHLFLISSASFSSIPFLSFIEPIFAWNVPLVSLIFLKRSLVFPIIFFSSISLHLAGRENSSTAQQKIVLKIYWAWPHPSEQDPVFPSVSLFHEEASISLLSFSIRGQTFWKPQSQKTN